MMDTEIETDRTIVEADSSSEVPSLEVSSASSWPWRILGALTLLTWTLLVLVVLILYQEPASEINVFLSYSLTAFLGFYLACGNIRWWWRWLVMVLTILLIVSVHFNPDKFQYIVYFGVLSMISAGFTYASRMILAAFRGESNPRQQFTIFGLMLVTTITAICLVALNHWFAEEGDPPIALLLTILIMLGFTMTAQLAAAWTRTKWEALAFAAIAAIAAVPASLVVYGTFAYIDDSPPDIEDVIYPVGLMSAFMWLILYPLWFSFYALGWKLIDPSWKLGPRHVAKPAAPREVKEFDVLMED